MTLAVLAASLVVQVALGREFGPIGLGDYNATSLFITVLTAGGFLGIPLAISQRVAMHDETGHAQGSETVSAAFAISLVFALLVGVMSAVLWDPFAAATRLRGPASAGLVAVAAALMIIQYFVVSTLLGRLRLATATVIVLAQPALVAAGVASASVSVEVAPSTLSGLGACATGAASLVYLAARPIAPRIGSSEVKALIARAVPGTGVLYINLLASWIDRLIVALITGPAFLGPYAAASNLIDGTLRVPRASGVFGVAAYARLADDAAGVQRVFDSHLRLTGSLFVVSGAVVMSGGRQLLTFAFGPGFESAGTALQILSIALLPMGLSLALASSGLGSGWVRLRTSFVAMILVLQLVAGVVGTSIFSIAGMAASSLVVWSITLIAYAFEARRRGLIRSFFTLARIASVAVPVLVISLIAGRLDIPLATALAISTATSVAAVAIFLIKESEVRLLTRMIPARLAARGD